MMTIRGGGGKFRRGGGRKTHLRGKRVNERTRKAQDPMKVDHSEAVSHACEEPLAKPSAPQRVNPSAPMRFQRPMCQPSVFGEGVCQFGWVSSMKSQEEIMKPVPPMT